MKTSQLKAGAVLSYLALFLNIAISLFYTPYMLRMLGRSEYGLFSLVNSVIAYLTILDFGFGNAIVRYTAKFRAEQDFEKERSMNGLFFILYSGIGILVIVMGLLLVYNVETLFGRSFNVAELKTVKVLMLLAVINVVLAFPFSIFSSIIQAYERFVFFQTVRIFRLVLTPISMVAILFLGYRSIGIVVATTVINVVFNLMNLFYCFKYLNTQFKFGDYDLLMFKEISIYSFYVFINLVVDRIYWSTGQFLLGMFAGTAAISIFTIGLQIAMYYIQLSTAFSGVFLPKITMISIQEDSHQLSELFIRLGRIQFVIIALALSGFILLGKQFVTLWAGLEYEQSYYIGLMLLVPLTVPLIQNLGITILQAQNRQGFRSLVYLALALGNVMISIPCTKAWGALGSAAATALALVAGQIIIMNIYYHKRIKLDIPKFWLEIGKMLPAVIGPAILEWGMVRWVPLTGIVGLLTHGSMFVVFYGLCMWLIGLNPSEKELILAPLRKVARRVRSL